MNCGANAGSGNEAGPGQSAAGEEADMEADTKTNK